MYNHFYWYFRNCIIDLYVNGSLQVDEINGVDIETLLNNGVRNRKLRKPGVDLIIQVIII